MDNRQKALTIQDGMCQLYMYMEQYFKSRDEGNRLLMEACLLGVKACIGDIDEIFAMDKVKKMPQHRHTKASQKRDHIYSRLIRLPHRYH